MVPGYQHRTFLYKSLPCVQEKDEIIAILIEILNAEINGISEGSITGPLFFRLNIYDLLSASLD